MAEFGNGLTEESLLDSDPGHPDLEDPGVGDEEPGLEEGEAAIEDPVSEGHCFDCEIPVLYPHRLSLTSFVVKQSTKAIEFEQKRISTNISGHMPCTRMLRPNRY